MRSQKHMWTGDELKKLVDLWNSKTLDEVAEEMGLKKSQIATMALQIRKVYPNVLQKKTRKGFMRSLITESLADLAE